MEFASPPPPPPDFQPPGQQPAPPSAAPRRRIPHAAMVGGLVFGMALGGAGIAFAAGSGSGTGSSTTAPTTPNGAPANPPGPGRHGDRMGGPMGLGLKGLGGRVLYGSATIETPSGTTKTIDFQLGTVTATNISGDSGTITVGSGTNNSHTQTYNVQPSTIVDSQAGGIATVKTGDKVVVIAQDNGSGNPTAMDIRDRTEMKNSRQGFGFGAPANPNGQNGSTTNPPAGTTSDFFGEVQ